MTAHTKGPWIYINDWPDMRIESADGKYLIADYDTSFIEYPGDDETEANARLIASAPELLEAPEKAELHLAAIGTPRDAQGRYHKDGEWTFGEALPRDADAREVSAAFALVRAAIAKAKGESA